MQLLFFKDAASRFCGKQHRASFCSFFSKRLIRVQVVQPYSSLDTATVWRIPSFFYQSSDYHMVDNLLIALHALLMCMLILLFVNGIIQLLLQCVTLLGRVGLASACHQTRFRSCQRNAHFINLVFSVGFQPLFIGMRKLFIFFKSLLKPFKVNS